MSTTALQHATKALRLIGCLDDGETISADLGAICLSALNDMLENLSLENLTVPRILDEEFNVSVGVATYTIGTGGAFNTTRPTAIERAYTRVDDIDDTVLVLPKQMWDLIPDKTTTSDRIQAIYYDPNMPLSTIYVWPIPSAVQSLHIESMQQFASFASLTTAATLPPGYNQMINYNLAVVLAPEMGREPPPAVVRIAMSSKADVKRKNLRNRDNVASYDVPCSSRFAGRANIITGM